MNYRILILVFLVIYSAYAKKDCPRFPGGDNSILQIIHDAEAILDFTKYDTDDMKFYVITPSSYPNFVNPDGENVDWSDLDCEDKPILVNCHGWRATGLDDWAVDLVRTFVQQYDGCAVTVDYRGSTENLNYLTVVVENTYRVSKKIADYIAENICTSTNCTEQLQLHGHSWGAHTCGIAGYLLGQKDPSFKPARIIGSDAAGPYFNKLNISDPTLHLSPESANTVIIIRTSKLAGSSRREWAHQMQLIGVCGSHQDQCHNILDIVPNESCDHLTSIAVTKSTMVKTFHEVNVRKCSSCHSVLTMLDNCSDEHDYLGWQSEGKPGLFVIKDIPVCLNTTLDSSLA